MLRASNRIEHGMKNKDGNEIVVIEAKQPVKGLLPPDVIKNLQSLGAIYDDARDDEEAAETAAAKDGKTAKA